MASYTITKKVTADSIRCSCGTWNSKYGSVCRKCGGRYKVHSKKAMQLISVQLPGIQEEAHRVLQPYTCGDDFGKQGWSEALIVVEAEDQRRGNSRQGVACCAVGKSDFCQESDIGLTIQSHCPSSDPQPCPRCGSIRALMKAVIAEKMRISSIMEARA